MHMSQTVRAATLSGSAHRDDGHRGRESIWSSPRTRNWTRPPRSGASISSRSPGTTTAIPPAMQKRLGRYLIKTGSRETRSAGVARGGQPTPPIYDSMQNLLEEQWTQVPRGVEFRPSMPWFVLCEMAEQDLRAVLSSPQIKNRYSPLLFPPSGKAPK